MEYCINGVDVTGDISSVATLNPLGSIQMTKPQNYLEFFDSQDNPDRCAQQMGLPGIELSEEVIDRRDDKFKEETRNSSRRLAGAMKAKGARNYAQVNRTINENLFGCSTQELYEHTQSRKSDRGDLPKTAQTALQVTNNATRLDIDACDMTGKFRPEIESECRQVAAENAKQQCQNLGW